MLPGCIYSCGDHLNAIKVCRKGEQPIRVIYCYGPFDPYHELNGDESSGELTLLAISKVGRDTSRLGMEMARKNLGDLLDIKRRRRERVG
jgi:hypothetical protein